MPLPPVVLSKRSFHGKRSLSMLKHIPNMIASSSIGCDGRVSDLVNALAGHYTTYVAARPCQPSNSRR